MTHDHVLVGMATVFFALGAVLAVVGYMCLLQARSLAESAVLNGEETARLRGWIEYAEGQCLERFGQAPTDMFGEALAGCPVPKTAGQIAHEVFMRAAQEQES